MAKTCRGSFVSYWEGCQVSKAWNKATAEAGQAKTSGPDMCRVKDAHLSRPCLCVWEFLFKSDRQEVNGFFQWAEMQTMGLGCSQNLTASY